ncbi:MAG: MFS transporter [Oscillospiraceae bacterium]|jgi:Na+/melibiose symporter-like transporter|nr:MFS transporter [Oscillospiraceae bacterium]
MEKNSTAKLKLNYPLTILTGFGFLGTQIAWQIYDPYITKILDKFLSISPTVSAWSARLADSALLRGFIESQGSNAYVAGRFTIVPLLIGIIMTFDNIFGVVFQPAFGKLSDNCHSRWGKRRPFIFWGAPISAVLFALIPWMPSLPLVMATIILFVFIMSLWRAPVVALMPDLTPPKLRSEANGVISFMGGLGSALGMAAGTVVTAIYLSMHGMTKQSPAYNEFDTFPAVFAIGAVVMIIGMLVLMFFVNEKDTRLLSAEVLTARNETARKAAEKEAKRKEKEELKQHKLSRSERKSLLLMLGGLFFLFCGMNAITTFFALFADEILHRDTAQATFLMLIFALCAMGGSLPAGWLGKRIGRKKTIVLGLSMMLGVFLTFFAAFLILSGSGGLSIGEYVRLNAAGQSSPEMLRTAAVLDKLIYPVMAVGGVASMFINVNTLPLVLEIGGIEKVGTFTGYYYTATFSAQIASPIAYGFFRMFSGTYLSLFYYSPIAFALSFLLILFVRHGEAIPQEVIKEAEAAGDS